MYCGVGRIPKGKRRGTIEECIKANQIRYYGLQPIDIKLLTKKKQLDLTDETLKLRTLYEKRKILKNEYAKVKILLENPKATNSQIKTLNAKVDAIYKKDAALIKKIVAQRKLLEDLKKQKEKEKEAARKKAAKKKAAKKKEEKKVIRRKKA